MINREATIRWKGYDPDELISGSSKRVWANCNICGRGRWLAKNDYRDLCFKCAMILRSGEGHAMYGKRGIETGMYGKKAWNSGLTKENNDILNKMSKNLEGKFDGSDNPNCNHEIDKFIKENTNKYICKCGCGKYIKIIRQHYHVGIPKYIRGHIAKGRGNPNWKGGISYEPYCDKFTEELKQQIRDQYANCDFISGLPDYICNVLNGRVWKLDVHHIDYNKTQGCGGVKWKLIPLSRRNHGKTNGNVQFWRRLFVYSLEYDESYYKLEDEFNLFGGI